MDNNLEENTISVYQLAPEDMDGVSRAANDGDLQKLKELEEQGNDIHTQKELPLFLAAAHGHDDVVKYLISKDADMKETEFALYWSSSNGHLEAVKSLVEAGASLKYEDGSEHNALEGAALFGESEVVEYLIYKGADVRKDNDRALFAASHRILDDNTDNYVKIATLLIQNGCDRKAMDEKGTDEFKEEVERNLTFEKFRKITQAQTKQTKHTLTK